MALGLGLDPFGDNRIGLDAIQPPERYALARIAAKKFDPKTRAFVVNIDGQYVGAHPVDQRVALILSNLRGSIPAVPQHGNPALGYTHMAADHVARVTKDLEQLLSPLVQAKEIAVHLIDVANPQNATLMQVDYTNLITGQSGLKAQA